MTFWVVFCNLSPVSPADGYGLPIVIIKVHAQVQMNRTGTAQSRGQKLTDLPNVGPAIARQLQSIGIKAPEDLIGKDPLELYEKLCTGTGRRQDPCLLDVFLSISDYMKGKEARRWWEYTAMRKRLYGRLR
jgi:hypothetical protein